MTLKFPDGLVRQPENGHGGAADVNTASILATTSNTTLSVNVTAQTITFDTKCNSFLLAPKVAPTDTIFIKYYDPTAGTQTAASATVRDRFVCATYPAIQEGRPSEILSMSIYTATTQSNVYLAQLI